MNTGIILDKSNGHPIYKPYRDLRKGLQYCHAYLDEGQQVVFTEWVAAPSGHIPVIDPTVLTLISPLEDLDSLFNTVVSIDPSLSESHLVCDQVTLMADVDFVIGDSISDMLGETPGVYPIVAGQTYTAAMSGLPKAFGRSYIVLAGGEETEGDLDNPAGHISYIAYLLLSDKAAQHYIPE